MWYSDDWWADQKKNLEAWISAKLEKLSSGLNFVLFLKK